MEGKGRLWDVFLTSVPAALWGSTYAVTQATLPPGRPFFAAATRALPVGLLMLLWIRRLPRADWWWRSVILGGLNIGLFHALLFVAAYRLPSGLGATMVATSPVATMVIARLVLGERPARVSVVAAVVGLVGVGLLVLENGLDEPVSALGVAAALGAVTLASTGFVLTKRWAPPTDVLTVTTWQLVAGGLILLPLALAVEGAPPALDGQAVLGLAYLGLLGSGLAYVLWFRGLAVLGPTPASIIGLVNPVVGVLLGVLFLGESFRLGHLVGMALIIAGVLVAQDPVGAGLARWVRGSRRALGPLPGPVHRIRPHQDGGLWALDHEGREAAPECR